MHVQIVTFNLGNLSEDDYLTSASAVAQAFSAQGGLMSKVWLERPDDGTYGAVYLWRDREAMERFLRSPLFEGNNSELEDVSSQDFGVLKNLTRKTQPELELISSPPAQRSEATPGVDGPASRPPPALMEHGFTGAELGVPDRPPA